MTGLAPPAYAGQGAAKMVAVSPRARTGPTREEKKAQTRRKLLDAAASVFAQKGIDGASLDDVADVAGLTKGAVYSNFASKEDLVWTLLEERLGEASLRIPGAVDPSNSQEQQSADAGALYMNLADRERDMFLLEYEYMLFLARHPEKRRAGNFTRRRDTVAQIIAERAAEAGVTLPMSATDLATATFALGAGITLERLVNPEEVPTDLFGRILALIFGYLDQPAASEKR
jgi:AcrR family transcriptional regulator